MKHSALLILLFLVYCTASQAETIYKSVDENGKVTYSATPPENSMKSTQVEVSPAPSDAQIKAAQERQKRKQEAADMFDENRKKRNELKAEEDRIKKQRQEQQQLQKQAEKNNENNYYGYPYIPGRRPGGVRPPIQLPAH